MPETLSEAEARLWHETPVYFFSWEDYFAWGAVAKLDPERSFRALRASPLIEPTKRAEVSAKDVDNMLAEVNLWLAEATDLPTEIRVEGLRAPAPTERSLPQQTPRPSGPLAPLQGQGGSDVDLDELGQERIRFRPERKLGVSGPVTTHPCPEVAAHVQSPGLTPVAATALLHLRGSQEQGGFGAEVQPWAAPRRPMEVASDSPDTAPEGGAEPHWAPEEGADDGHTEGAHASSVNREAACLALVSALRPKASTPRPWRCSFASPLPPCPLATTLSAPTTVGQIWPLGLPPLDLPPTPVDTLDLWRRGWMVSLVVRPHRWSRYLRH